MSQLAPADLVFLNAFIQLVHGPCTHLRTAQVRQMLNDRTLWMGSVAIFRLLGSPAPEECFAWIPHGNEAPPVVYLKVPPVDSPAAAVRAHVQDLCHELMT